MGAAVTSVLAASLVACGSGNSVDVNGKKQVCTHGTKVVDDSKCQSPDAGNENFVWIYLLLLNNGSTRSVPYSTYTSTSVGDSVDDSEGTAVDENGDTVEEPPAEDPNVDEQPAPEDNPPPEEEPPVEEPVEVPPAEG